MAHASDVAGRIREMRESRGLTQAALGARLGVTRSQVTLWETGGRNPSPTSLKQIALALGVAVEWLVTGRGSAKPAHPPNREVNVQLFEVVVEAVHEAFKDHRLDTNSKRFAQVVVTVYASALFFWPSASHRDPTRFREHLLDTAKLALGA
jgi:transcriptional regulator with XRE-family HTH domain